MRTVNENDYEKINKAVLEFPETVLEIPDYEGSLKGYRCSRFVLASVRACWPFYVQENRSPAGSIVLCCMALFMDNKY